MCPWVAAPVSQWMGVVVVGARQVAAGCRGAAPSCQVAVHRPYQAAAHHTPWEVAAPCNSDKARHVHTHIIARHTQKEQSVCMMCPCVSIHGEHDHPWPCCTQPCTQPHHTDGMYAMMPWVYRTRMMRRVDCNGRVHVQHVQSKCLQHMHWVHQLIRLQARASVRCSRGGCEMEVGGYQHGTKTHTLPTRV